MCDPLFFQCFFYIFFYIDNGGYKFYEKMMIFHEKKWSKSQKRFGNLFVQADLVLSAFLRLTWRKIAQGPTVDVHFHIFCTLKVHEAFFFLTSDSIVLSHFFLHFFMHFYRKLFFWPLIKTIDTGRFFDLYLKLS